MALLDFDRSKPFYPLVVNCVASVWGYKELSVHGLVDPADRRPGLMKDVEAPEIPGVQRQVINRLHDTPHIDINQPLVIKRTHGDALQIDSRIFARELIDNVAYLSASSMIPMRALVITAYEAVKDPWRVETDPLWEFFRHVRNAAAHGGKFTFKPWEPSRTAKWASLEVTKALEGGPLFRLSLDGPPGFMQPGDVFEMLRDVERANPNMTVV